MAGGCIFKKAAAAPAAEAPAAGGCIFKKASSAPSAAPAGVCPMSGASKKPQEGSCPVSGKGKSVDDMFKDAENMSGCPMFEASPEEAEKMRQEAAGDLDAPKQDSQGKCPMTGAPGQATGCPMAQPGDHPELDGTWMAPVSDDPDACPTFLPRPILDPPKYSGVKTKKMKADDGLVILEEAENEVRATFDFTLEKIRMGEAEQLADNVGYWQCYYYP